MTDLNKPQNSDPSLGSIQPVFSQPINKPILFAAPLGNIPTGQGTILSTITQNASSLTNYLSNYKSVKIVDAWLEVSVSSNIAQAAACDIVWAMVKNDGTANPNNVISAQACVQNAQSGQVLLTNAGFTNSKGPGGGAGVYTHPLNFEQNGISPQLVGTVLGNQAPPIIRIFGNTSGGDVPEPEATQLGLFAQVKGHVLLEGPF